jgi:hypothetical protein
MTGRVRQRVPKLGPQLFQDDRFDDEERRRLYPKSPAPSPGGSWTPNWELWRQLPAWSRDEFMALAFAPSLMQITGEPLPVLLRRHIGAAAHRALDRAIAVGQHRSGASGGLVGVRQADWVDAAA